jgi:integrase
MSIQARACVQFWTSATGGNATGRSSDTTSPRMRNETPPSNHHCHSFESRHFIIKCYFRLSKLRRILFALHRLSSGKKLAALARPVTIINRHLVPHFGATPLNQLTMENGLAYIEQRRAGGAAEGTLARECGVLQAILNYAVALDVLDKNRLWLLPAPEWTSRERVATPDELIRLLTAASDPVRRLIVLALQTTLRESKLIEIHEEWIVRRGDGPWLLLSSGSRHKRVPKEVPLTALALRALNGDQSRIGRRFFSQWKDGNSFKHRWGELCRKAGVHDLTFHDLRHTAASWLLEAVSTMRLSRSYSVIAYRAWETATFTTGNTGCATPSSVLKQ